jgi:hypothetical protein
MTPRWPGLCRRASAAPCLLAALCLFVASFASGPAHAQQPPASSGIAPAYKLFRFDEDYR